MIPTSTPAEPPSLVRARIPSSHTSKQRGPAHGRDHGAAQLTLVEADLVSQDHHALRQQLVLEGTHGDAVTALRGSLGSWQAGLPRARHPAAKARWGRDSPTSQLPPAAEPEPQPLLGGHQQLTQPRVVTRPEVAIGTIPREGWPPLAASAELGGQAASLPATNEGR